MINDQYPEYQRKTLPLCDRLVSLVVQSLYTLCRQQSGCVLKNTGILSEWMAFVPAGIGFYLYLNCTEPRSVCAGNYGSQ